MRRSASLQGIVPAASRIPSQSSSAKPEALPLRMAARRYSARQLPLPPPAQEHSELTLLRAQNSALRAENDRLRRELATLCARPPPGTTQTDSKVPAYRDIIRSKLTARTKTSRVTTECETAVMDSKEASIQTSRHGLDVLYDNYLGSRLPALEDLAEIVQRFFQEYSHNYAKIKALLATIDTNRQRPEYQKLQQLIELYKVPLLYQKSPQALFRELSKDKPKGRQQGKEGRGEGRDQLCLELLSPQETVTKFQAFLQKICRSGQMIRTLRTNEQVQRFIAKIEGGRH